MAIQYALVPLGDRASISTEAVILDQGGPGRSNLAAHFPTTLLNYVDSHSSYGWALILDEPWTRRENPALCKAEMTNWYLSIRGDTPVSGRTLAENCSLEPGKWGWNKENYVDAVTQIKAKEGLQISGFVGVSFGSVRASYLADSAITYELYAPANLTGSWEDLIAAKSRAVTLNIMKSLNHTNEAETRNWVKDRYEKLQAHPVKVPGRSIEVNGIDFLAALIFSSYLNEEEYQGFLQGLSQDSVAELQKIGRSSDQIFGRFGIDQISPAQLALWTEHCPILDSAGGELLRETELVEKLLSQFYSVCSSIQDVEPPLVFPVSSCVVLYEDDWVIPTSMWNQMDWDVARLLRVDSLSHGSGALGMCSKKKDLS